MAAEATAPRSSLLEALPVSDDGGTREERVASVLVSLVPGAMVVYLSFHGGGFFPAAVAFVALLVVQMLVIRIMWTSNPFVGCSRRHLACVVAFAGYTVWTLASALWSHTLARALIEFDRALMYLLLLLLFGLLGPRVWRLRLVVFGLALGSLGVCLVALASRVLPHLIPTASSTFNNRLNYPITYWNALGILATICVLLLVGITASGSERRTVRAVAAAGVPVAATTLFFTFSRGAIAAAAIGLVIVVVLGVSSSLWCAVLATLPATAFPVVAAYHANLLDQANATSSGAVTQGRHVAITVAGACVAAFVLRVGLVRAEAALSRVGGRLTPPRGPKRGLIAGTIVAGITGLIIVGAPGWVSREARAFSRPGPNSFADFRVRLTDPSSNGRIDHWRVALRAFSAHPVSGTGAGTFEFQWYRRRPVGDGPVVNAHSLYLQTLSDLGLVGLGLLVTTLGLILWAVATARPLLPRGIHAGLFAAVVALVLHAGVDWDWEMPAVTGWLFAVGGIALASRSRAAAGVSMSGRGRIVTSLALLIAAVTPAILVIAEARLGSAASSFQAGNCTRARSQALSAIDILAIQPEPYQILGYCDIYDERMRDAVAAMRSAVTHEPGSWEFHWGEAIADGYAGLDPRPALRAALRLNPGDPLVLAIRYELRSASPRTWLRASQDAYAATTSGGRLTLR